MSENFHEPTELVATPRSLDKRWTRLMRGDRGCLFDAMSLVGAVLTIAAVSLAKMEVFPWMVAYVCGGTWVLGFLLGTRAQWRSGARRREALTQGPLVALGIIEAEPQLSQKEGRRAPVGRALVLMVKGEPGEALRDGAKVSAAARAIKKALDEGRSLGPEIDALREDSFCFKRLGFHDKSIADGDWKISRLIVHGDRLAQGASPVQSGSVIWGIYDEELDILEHAICNS